MEHGSPVFRIAGMAIAFALIVAACASEGDSAEQATTQPGSSVSGADETKAGGTGAPGSTLATEDGVPQRPAGSEETVFAPGEIDPGMGPYIDIAVADLAGRLGIPSTDILVVTAVPVVWSDAGLGCPRPDMFYTQVPQDGSVIELDVNGKVYRYHSGGSREPFLCDQPLTKKPATSDIGLSGGGSSD